MSRRFRLIHRWVSLAFLATVVLAVGGALGLPEWLFYLPLAPLLLLMATGIYLNVQTFRRDAHLPRERR